jgi:hypothetical protein
MLALATGEFGLDESIVAALPAADIGAAADENGHDVARADALAAVLAFQIKAIAFHT